MNRCNWEAPKEVFEEGKISAFSYSGESNWIKTVFNTQKWSTFNLTALKLIWCTEKEFTSLIISTSDHLHTLWRWSPRPPPLGVSGAVCRAGVGTAGAGTGWKEPFSCWMSQAVSVCRRLSQHVSHPRLWREGLEYIRQSCRSIWCHFRCNRCFD